MRVSTGEGRTEWRPTVAEQEDEKKGREKTISEEKTRPRKSYKSYQEGGKQGRGGKFHKTVRGSRQKGSEKEGRPRTSTGVQAESGVEWIGSDSWHQPAVRPATVGTIVAGKRWESPRIGTCSGSAWDGTWIGQGDGGKGGKRKSR